MWRIEFLSDKFLPLLPEECQENPGAYGFELAFWLSQALVKQGIVTSYPLGEDWGWLIQYINDELEVTIGCSSDTIEGDGYKGEPIKWGIFIRPHQSFKRLLKGVSIATSVERLSQAISAALEDENIFINYVEKP